MNRNMIKNEIFQQQQTKTNMNTLIIQVEEEIQYSIDKCGFNLSIQHNSLELRK